MKNIKWLEKDEDITTEMQCKNISFSFVLIMLSVCLWSFWFTVFLLFMGVSLTSPVKASPALCVGEVEGYNINLHSEACFLIPLQDSWLIPNFSFYFPSGST